MAADSGEAEFLKVGDHPALDFLNTTVMENGVLTDRLQSDTQVLRWLATMGFAAPRNSASEPGALLTTARAVRESLRSAVENAKAGKRLNLHDWNGLLAKASSHLALALHDGQFHIERRWPHETPEQVLGPLLESAMQLLATGDFTLIRHCEDDTCVLWFYDRTKSHRRRWCSMTACGNRNKVAAFRQRQQAGARLA